MQARFTVVCFLIPGLFFTSFAYGQRERRRQFVDGLLEGLIESQLEKLIDEDPRQSGQPGQTVRPAAIPAEVQNARGELAHISGSLQNLVSILQHESYSTPAYRQPLAEAMHIKASVDALFQQSARIWDLRRLADAYVPVDQRWRSLAHALKQARGLNRSVLAIVDEVNEHAAEMGLVLGLQPQLDRTELIRLSSTLTTEFRHLLEDISYDMGSNRSQARILQRGRELLTQVRQATAWIDQGDYDSLVQAWQAGQAGWRPFAAELRREGSERVRRDVMKIETTGRQITKALWLPIPVDKDYLVHLVSSVERNTDHILTTVSMKDLMAMPNPDRLLSAAAELEGYFGSFSQSITASDSIDDLVWDFRVFEVAWRELASECQSINNPEVQRHLRDSAETMALLNQSLGSGPQISPDEIIRMVSELGELSNRTAIFVSQNILPASEYDYRLKTSIQQQVVGLQTAVRSLHTRMISRQSEQLIRQDLEKVTSYWNELKPLMRQVREKDQQGMRQLRGELEPLMVKLQVVYSR